MFITVVHQRPNNHQWDLLTSILTRSVVAALDKIHIFLQEKYDYTLHDNMTLSLFADSTPAFMVACIVHRYFSSVK